MAHESSLSYYAIPAAALRGRGPLEALRGTAVLLRGTLAARRLVRRLRPRAVLGTGGYVCVPVFLAARMAGVPTMVYLPDVVPGLAVRLLARIATRVAVNVEDALPRLGLHRGHPRALVAGYPVRPALFHQERAHCRRVFALADELPALLVYGGSRGARSINRAVAALLPKLLAECQIIHVCGREGDETWLHEAAAALPATLRERYKLFPYLEAGAREDRATGGKRSDRAEQEKTGGTEGRAVLGKGVSPSNTPLPAHTSPLPTMTAALGAADLALCRSGASTLAELPASGLAAVLVPYPYVHQDENADYLVSRGAAVKVADAAMLGGDRPEAGALYPDVMRLLRDKHERQAMAERSRALAQPDAARCLADALLGLAARSRD